LSERKKIINKAHPELSITRQCQLLGLQKSSYYYKPKGESAQNLELMKIIDQQYTKHPHMGVPSMTTWLRLDQGMLVNHKRIARLYRMMDLQALIPGPHTSKGVKEHKKYPYLLRNLIINKVNQVWATDITYIPMEKGFMYLMAVIDIHSRYIVGWSLSNTMEAEWCKETIQECIEEHGAPEIVNTDQGAQFTSDVFTEYLTSQGVSISMDGKGRASDTIFIERFWRSLKYEKIYKYSYSNGHQLALGIIEYMSYYNHERRHSSIDNQKPFYIFEKGHRDTSSKPKEKPHSMNCKGQDEWSAAGATQTSLDKS